MGPRLWIHLPPGSRPDAVVADRSRGAEALVDVCACQLCDEPGLDGIGGPDTGVAIGLEFGADGAAIRPLCVAADPLEDPAAVFLIGAQLDELLRKETRGRGRGVLQLLLPRPGR